MNEIELTICKNLAAPVYMQLIEQFEEMIDSGKLPPGTKLPSERELAEKLNLARGTIKKAYLDLIGSKRLMVVKGRGTFVPEQPHRAPANRLEKAQSAIESAITTLENLSFSHKEITSLFTSILAQREEIFSNFAIAAIDCNPEALSVYQRQIALLKNLNVSQILLSELQTGKFKPSRLLAFDMIVTTTTHFNEIGKIAPEIADKIVQVSVSPSPETMIEMAAIKPDSPAGIVHYSEKFQQIVQRWLTRFHPGKRFFCFSLLEKKDMKKFLEKIETLIVPPVFAHNYMTAGRLMNLRDFRQRGGKILNFEYKIDPGSLVHIETRIKELIYQKGTQGN